MDTEPHPKGTPLPTKAKGPQEVIGEEQQKILNDIMGKPQNAKKPAVPKNRPATSYVPKNVRTSGFKYLKDVNPKDIPEDTMPKRSARPQTAKPSKKQSLIERDEFIQKKLAALQDIEKSLDEQISNFKIKNPSKSGTVNKEDGIIVTKEFLLKKSNCDRLEDIECLILRECKIRKFDNTKELDLDELVNLECLYASHNLLNDLYGIAKLTTLIELNLNNNDVSDILPLEELTNL